MNGVAHCPTLDMKSKPALCIYRAFFFFLSSSSSHIDCDMRREGTHTRSTGTSCSPLLARCRPFLGSHVGGDAEREINNKGRKRRVLIRVFFFFLIDLQNLTSVLHRAERYTPLRQPLTFRSASIGVMGKYSAGQKCQRCGARRSQCEDLAAAAFRLVNYKQKCPPWWPK